MMKTTFVTMLALGTWPLISTAMPTKAELDKVSPVVADLMRPEQEALKAGKKSKSEVAAIALELVAKADGEAAKLLLTKGAYNLYVRDGDFDKAIATLKSFREIVPDMEPQYLANIIESSLRTISRKNGGQLYQLLDETRTIARYRSALKKLEAQAKNAPTDKSLQLKLAEHYAVLNDWTKALDAFALSSDRKASDVAKMEKADAKALKVAADFWWNYPVRKAPEFEKPFRQHAAKLYEQAIASGELVGLNKVQADRRIAEANMFSEFFYEVPVNKDGLYCVIDLSGGWNTKHYSVCYLDAEPKGGWTDEYKTTKLVLRRVEPGRFLREGRPVTIDRPFYLGVFEMTQMQYKLISSNNPSQTKNALFPVVNVSYDMIRGESEGALWPATNSVDATSILGKLRTRTGLDCDLPTEAQWEYACRAGAMTTYGYGVNPNGDYMWHKDNSEATVHIVGKRIPNRWGFYDMHGNVWEWCLDWYDGQTGSATGLFGARSGKYRINRGGNYKADATVCTSSKRNNSSPSCVNSGIGFRLAIQPPFVPQTTIDGSAQLPDTSLAKAKREMEEMIAAQREDKLYCVVDLSGGPNAKRYPVSYLNSAPKTGWSDEYKTTKLVLRKIKPGKEPLGRYVITNGYYIGVFEVTQRQWELVCGKNPSEFVNPMHPVEMVSYGVIRGTSLGDAWVRTIDEGTFIGNMRHRAGLKFDLPVEKQWEYACRAGTVSSFNNGGNDIDDLLKLGKFEGNGGRTEHHSQVGSFVPNAWGIYDMHGNVRECCLDWTSSSQHISRGGNFLNHFNECTSTFRGHSMSHDGVRNYVGFRLVVLP